MFPLVATGVIDTSGKFAAGVVDTGAWQIATGVVDTGGKLPPVSLTPVANLPPLSTLQGKLVAKFAAGVVDTGGKLSPASLTPVANLPPLANLDLRISPRFFEKI